MFPRLSMIVLCIVLAGALIMPALAAPPAAASSSYPARPSDSQVDSALDFLRSQQAANGSIIDFATSAWAATALAAAGYNPHNISRSGGPSVIDCLKASAEQATKTSDYSRMILAAVAADENPADFGGIDFVTLLKSEYDGTQIDDPTLLSDDFWGLMALIAADDSNKPEIINGVASFIINNQNSDGGWSWGVGAESDVDDTAAAVMALIAAGEPQNSDIIRSGLDYMKSMQMDNGGFDSWGSTNSGTNSWAVLAIVAAGQSPVGSEWQSPTGNDPLDDLMTFQNADGSFNWQPDMALNTVLMTSYAVQAMLGQPYPVAAAGQAQNDDETSATWAIVVGVIGGIILLSLAAILVRRRRTAVKKMTT